MKKIRLRKTFLYLMLLFTMTFLMGCSVADIGKVKKKGSFTEEIDYSISARAAFDQWIAGSYLSEKIDSSEYINDIKVTLNVDIYSDNSYELTVDEESYMNALNKANAGAKAALTELIIERSKSQSGIEITKENIDSLMIEKTDLSLDDYIKKYGPTMLPSLADIKDTYNKKNELTK